MMRRALAIAAVFLSLTFSGCTLFNPPPEQPCTVFGCQKQGNIVRELGGTILFMGIFAGAIAFVVRRSAK